MSTQNCVAALPEVFALDDEGIATVVGAVDGENQDLLDAVGECPVSALKLIRDDGAS